MDMSFVLSVLLLIVEVVVVISVMLVFVAYATWLERKVFGYMQVRLGVTHTGPFGLLQPLADALKLIAKESFTPHGVDKFVYTLAPLLALFTALTAFSVIPFADWLIISNMNVGLLFILAMASVGVYGIVMAGWSSNSKYPMISSLRVSAQVLSYEVGMMLALLAPVLVAGTLNLNELIKFQSEHIWLVIPEFIAFVIYVISGVAETNRAPFDLAEAENEIVAGFFTEYTSMRFGLFFMAEYANMYVVSCVATVVFLGGWSGPFLPGIVWFLIKMMAVMFFYLWLRATFPRLRYDQLMDFGWKVLIPVGLANLIITAFAVFFIRVQ